MPRPGDLLPEEAVDNGCARPKLSGPVETLDFWWKDRSYENDVCDEEYVDVEDMSHRNSQRFRRRVRAENWQIAEGEDARV